MPYAYHKFDIIKSINKSENLLVKKVLQPVFSKQNIYFPLNLFQLSFYFHQECWKADYWNYFEIIFKLKC